MFEYTTLYNNEIAIYADKINSRIIRELAEGFSGITFLYLCYYLGKDKTYNRVESTLSTEVNNNN